jgi:RND family efflux transporter MFP subunit
MNAVIAYFGRFVLAIGFGTAVAGCSPKSADGTREAPPLFQVSHPIEREVTDYSDNTGRAAAIDSVEVRSRVWGYLDKVNFKEGMLVKKDDVLFEIDARTYKAAQVQAEGNLASAKARLARLELDVKRNEELVKRNTVAQQEYDKSVGDRDETAASIIALQGALDQARLDLGFTKVTAPVSGRVGRALVTQGNLVQSGQAGGTVLTTIASVDPMYVYFDVDERTVLRVRQLIREGKFKSARDVVWPVFLGLANEEGYPHEGTIDFVDNQVNPKVGTLRVRGVFPNKDEWLSPGYFVRVRVPIGRPYKALLVTERALDSDQGQKIVYVVGPDNKVAVRPVRLGALRDGLRVIEAGLSPDDRVVVAGLQQLRAGMAVEPKLVDMPVQNLKSASRNLTTGGNSGQSRSS